MHYMIRVMRWACILIVLLFPALARSEDKLAVPIVDGINNHDWRTATRELDVSTTRQRMPQLPRGTHGIRTSPDIAW
jgi:hypothetical protein